jgi:hypothetical protein
VVPGLRRYLSSGSDFRRGEIEYRETRSFPLPDNAVQADGDLGRPDPFRRISVTRLGPLMNSTLIILVGRPFPPLAEGFHHLAYRY